MRKAILVLSVCLLLLTGTANSLLAWTAYSFTTVKVGDYWWRNYDYESQSDPDDYQNVDWPISVIFYGPGAEVDAAHAMYWFPRGGIMNATYHDNYSSWTWDSDSGRKSAWGDGDAWHLRIYAETSGDRCTHSTWTYYVVATTHRDYTDGNPAYFGNTNLANVYILAKAEETVGSGNIVNNLVYMANSEGWRYEGGSAPYHLWYHDGYADGVYMN